MIIALRKRHRLIIVGLSFLVPIGFAIGISARSSIPAGNHARLNGSRTLGRTSEVWARDDLWVGKTIATRLLKEDGLIAQFGIELNSHEPIVHPDFLVYWVGSEQKISDSLP